MKKLFPLLLFLLPIAMQAQQLQAKIDYAQFATATGEPYIEVYMYVPSGEVQFQPGLIWLRASLTFEVIVSKNDTIAFFDRYNLNIKGIDSARQHTFFVREMVRFPLNDGNYLLEVNITDSFSNKTYPHSQDILVKGPGKALLFSDIVLADSIYNANGTDKFNHYNYSFLPNESRTFVSGNQLYFYAELYNADVRLPDDTIITINYFIKKGNNKVGGTERQRKMKPNAINQITSLIKLKNFAAADYTLHLQVLNSKGRIVMVAQTPFSVKPEPIKPPIPKEEVFNIPELKEMEALAFLWQPQKNKADLAVFNKYLEAADTMNAFLWLNDHWKKTLAAEKEETWNSYLDRLRQVNNKLSSKIREGYQTDQGRIYFNYGPPNQAQQFPDDPAAYPYEIWEYYLFGNQRNITFVFYNPTQIENEFVLLHSNARGEFRNPNWRKVIYQRTNTNNNLDDPRVRQIHGGNRGM